MFAHVTADLTPRHQKLCDLGFASGSDSNVCLNEITYSKGTEIYGQDEPAEYVYQLKSGAVRSYKLLSDGRRQIGAFHLAGDIFGLTSEENHRFTTEAIVDTTLWLIKRHSLQATARTDAALTRTLLRDDDEKSTER